MSGLCVCVCEVSLCMGVCVFVCVTVSDCMCVQDVRYVSLLHSFLGFCVSL